MILLHGKPGKGYLFSNRQQLQKAMKIDNDAYKKLRKANDST